MKRVKRSGGPVFQGDLMIVPCDNIPVGASEVRPVNGQVIVAHSETGHHHTVSACAAKVFAVSAMLQYLRVTAAHVDLLHQRSYDQHEALRLPKGDYEMLRQREGSPEGWRRVMD